MKKILNFSILSCLAILLACCDDGDKEESGYILVTVNLKAEVWQGEMGSNPLANESVIMSIERDGEEQHSNTWVTDASGSASITVTFKLYKDQSIEACVELADLPGNYNCETVTWMVVDAGAVEQGGERVYTWAVTLGLVYPL